MRGAAISGLASASWPGLVEKALEKFLQRIGVQRQAYYSGAFVGNHVHILLNNLDGLWDAMRSAANDATPIEGEETPRAKVDEIIERVRPFWENFSVLHRECRKNKVLTDAEVETLCKAAAGMVRGARRAFPEKHLELKLHVIESHLVEFVKTWRSAGLFIEDAIESLHNLVNKLNRRFSCLHGKIKSESKLEALAVLRRPAVVKKVADRKARMGRGSYKKAKTD